MKQSKTDSYKYITELKNDIRIILLAQTAFYIYEI